VRKSFYDNILAFFCLPSEHLFDFFCSALITFVHFGIWFRWFKGFFFIKEFNNYIKIDLEFQSWSSYVNFTNYYRKFEVMFQLYKFYKLLWEI